MHDLGGVVGERLTAVRVLVGDDLEHAPEFGESRLARVHQRVAAPDGGYFGHPGAVELSVKDHLVVTEGHPLKHIRSRGTSLNQLVRDFLNDLTRMDDVESVVAQLDTLWAVERYRSPGSWTREELHERS